MTRQHELFRPTRIGGPLPAREEASSIGCARGHLVHRGGLRGHSVDEDTYPWRVVGVGDAWEVHDIRGDRYARGEIDFAHAQARALKVQHPHGYVPQGQVVSGPAETVPERLAGRAFQLYFHGTGEVHRYRALTSQDSPHEVQVIGTDVPVTMLGVYWLQIMGEHVELELELGPFYRQQRVEIEP